MERSPGIKSARIKNASSETSYSRFLPVVGINRPFRRRCINRNRGRVTLLLLLLLLLLHLSIPSSYHPFRSRMTPFIPGSFTSIPAIVDNKTSILTFVCFDRRRGLLNRYLFIDTLGAVRRATYTYIGIQGLNLHSPRHAVDALKLH